MILYELTPHHPDSDDGPGSFTEIAAPAICLTDGHPIAVAATIELADWWPTLLTARDVPGYRVRELTQQARHTVRQTHTAAAFWNLTVLIEGEDPTGTIKLHDYRTAFEPEHGLIVASKHPVVPTGNLGDTWTIRLHHGNVDRHYHPRLQPD